jgi:hypothetical protein
LVSASLFVYGSYLKIKPMKKKLLFFTILVFCMAVLFTLTESIDKKYPPVVIEDMLYLPSGNFLKGAALGFDEMLADLLWIKALAYFGGHAVTDQDYSWLGHLLDIVTTLDPFSQYPYEFGGVILATEIGDVDKSTALLKKGMENVSKTHARYWYLPFFTAFNYMYYKYDYKTAAHYLEMASKFPQSPDYIPLLISRLYADADSPEIAITFLREMIKSTQKPELKEKLKLRLNEVINQSNIQFLEAAKDRFFSKFNQYPETIDQMFKNGFIFYVPTDPRGGTYYISPKDHTVKNTKKSEALKVHINKKQANKN